MTCCMKFDPNMTCAKVTCAELCFINCSAYYTNQKNYI